MNSLFHNSRFYVLLSSVILSLVIFGLVNATIPNGSSQLVHLEEWYALLSVTFLYMTLLAGPFCYTFRSFPYRGYYLKSRRALGVSSFYFACLHVLITFFGQLGGFSGLGFLSTKYLVAVSLGAIALSIMVLLTITSLDYMVSKMTFPKWKLLHRFGYLAGILILIHTFMLGSHFSDVSGSVSQITFLALAFLLLLEAPRIDKLFKRFFSLPTVGFSFLFLSVILGILFFTIINPVATNGGVSFDIHAAHKQLAAQALQQTQQTIPGLNGDRNKRYTVSFLPPDSAIPLQDTTLRFRINDASSGNPVYFFRTLYAKPMHLIISDSSLSYFSHIHPVQQGNEFSVTTQFPANGVFHLYSEFQPFGGIEQQVGFVLPVGISQTDTAAPAIEPVDKKMTKTFGEYNVTLDTHGQLRAEDMTLGNDKLTFTIRDAKTKKPITTLKPYLASFGHLTMINEKTYDFIHVHPYSLLTPPPDANGGPTVDFLPIGIYGPFSKGIYRVFAEFNPNGHLITADFTVAIK